MSRKEVKVCQGVSRQRRWQLKKEAAGACIICGLARGENGTRTHCRKHADAHSARVLPKANARHRRHPEKVDARNAVAIALYKGLLVRPETCSACGVQDKKINAHHPDYAKPLDVVWLCYRCHAEEEKRGTKKGVK